MISLARGPMLWSGCVRTRRGHNQQKLLSDPYPHGQEYEGLSPEMIMPYMQQ